MSVSLNEIVNLVQGQVQSSQDVLLHGLAPLDQATSKQLSFLSDKKYLSQLGTTQAGVVLVKAEYADQCPSVAVIVDDPYLAFAKISHLFDPEPQPLPSIHPSAVIADDVFLGDGVFIGPNVVIESGCHIDDGVILEANVVVGARSRIGKLTRIHPNVTLYHDVQMGERCIIHAGCVLGSHGYGFANHQGQWQKIAQIGRLIIGNDVEMGGNCSIDRGALGDTRIEDGVKLDNLLHIAHNVVIGKHTALAGQIGISGSTTIGAHCMAGGQCGFAGHIEIADGCVFTGQAMVTKSITEPGVYSSGQPAISNKEWRKMNVRMRQLDEMARKLKDLEKQIGNTD